TFLTRTDFLIQFVWQPKPEEKPKTPEEEKTKLEDITKTMLEAQKNNTVVTLPKESDIEAASIQQSKVIDTALQKAQQKAAAPAPGAPAASAPAAATPPAAPPAAPK